MNKKLVLAMMCVILFTSFSVPLNASVEFVEQSGNTGVDTYSTNISCNSARDFSRNSLYYCNYSGYGTVTGKITNKENTGAQGPGNNSGVANVWIDDCGLANGGGSCRTVAKSEGNFLSEGFSKSVKYTHGTNSENEHYRTGGKYTTTYTSDGKVRSSLY